MKTYSTKASDIKREWHAIDASDKVLGRLATQVASLLMGKHKPMFSPNLDTGDFVVVINAEKIRVTGGLKSIKLEKLMQTNPTRVIEHAVKGMLPHNRLGAKMFKKLRVYVGDTHPHPTKAKPSSTGVVTKES